MQKYRQEQKTLLVDGDPKYYHITFGNFKFEAEVSHESEDVVHVQIGGKNRKCIRINVADATVGEIIKVEHDYRCCLAPAQLGHGDGTRAMVGAAIVLISRMFPRLKLIRFMDSSAFDCSRTAPNGKEIIAGSVDLAPHQLLIYGRTWYERILTPDFVVPEKGSRPKIARVRDVGQYSIKNRPFKDLWKFIARTSTCDHSEAWLLDNKAKLEALWHKCDTLSELATGLQKMRDEESCLFWVGFIKRLYMFAGKDYSDAWSSSWVIKNPHACAEHILYSWNEQYKIKQVDLRHANAFVNFNRRDNVMNYIMTRGRMLNSSGLGSIGDYKYLKKYL